MTINLIRIALASSALLMAAPAAAVTLVPGSSMVQPTAGLPEGQGTLLASTAFTGTALTFSATFNQAVYRNDAGTLDFYYQVIRTGPGTVNDQEVRSFTVSDFDGFDVEGFAFGGDPDGAGIFVAANNPTLADGQASNSTTTFGRSPSSGVLTTEFGVNGLTGTQNSATYIFRTNATAFNTLGTFGVIDGSTLQGTTFQPIAAVPEPASWAMMIAGFGLVGSAMRRRTSRVSFAI